MATFAALTRKARQSPDGTAAGWSARGGAPSAATQQWAQRAAVSLDASLEREADRAADRVLGGETSAPLSGLGAAGPAIQRRCHCGGQEEPCSSCAGTVMRKELPGEISSRPVACARWPDR